MKNLSLVSFIFVFSIACTGNTFSQSGEHLTVNNTVGDIVNHPAFSGFGERLLTRDDNSSYYKPRSGKDCSWN